MWIKELAVRSGLSIDTVRFYEKRGLIDPRHFRRLENGYRDYAEGTVERLLLIKGAQVAGFRLDEIRELLTLWEQDQLTEAEIRARYARKLAEISAKRRELDRIEQHIYGKLRQLDSDKH